MKIAVLTNSYPTQANPHDQIFVKKLAEEINADPKFEVNVYYNYIYKIVKKVGDKKSLFWTLIKYLASVLSFLHFFVFKCYKYDVLFTQAVIYNSYYGFICKKIFKKKYVIYVHGGDINLYNEFSKLNKNIINTALKNADHIIVNSKNIEQKVVKISSRNDVSIISPGVDTKVFQIIPNTENPYIEKLKINSSQIVLSFVGNAIKRKGVSTYLESLAMSKEYLLKRDVRLLFVTEGPLLGEIKSSIQNIGLAEKTIFLKKLSHRELNYIYNLTDVLVFPSLNEPLGLVGLEAMAVETIVIGSKTGGIKEYISDKKNGFLFEPGNSKELSNLIEMVINNRDKLSLEMKDTVEKYSLTNSAIEVKRIIQEL